MPKVTTKERALIQPLGLETVEFGKAPPHIAFTHCDWQPEIPPQLGAGEKVGLDFEYDPNERDVTQSKPIAFSVWSPERKKGWYIPWGHEGGGNLPEGVCRRWYADNLRDRDVYGLNVKAEMHMTFNWGLDPDRLGIRPHDVAFGPTLLKEDRTHGFSLEALAEEYLPPDERKIHPEVVPAQHFKLAHAGMVAARGVSDAMLAWRIHEVTQEKILAEALDRCQDMEDRCILPVVEMERNGALLDRGKLERWAKASENRMADKVKEIETATAIKGFNPDRGDSWERLFKHLGLPKPTMFNEQTGTKEESWGAEALDPLAKTHPLIDAGLMARHYKSMLSKYFDKYLRAMDSNNVIRYGLHQMRAVKDFGVNYQYGTCSGRFSCGGGAFNVNIQQVMKCEAQIEDWGNEFVIRELFIPELGRKMGASDASQIEFRLFGHYSQSPFVVSEYQRDPWVDFHMLVTMLMNPGVTDKAKLKALRKHMKHNNFGVLYGMGRPKLARRLGLPCTCPFDWYEKRWDERRGRGVNVRYFGDNDKHLTGCPAIQANDIMDEYNLKFPEASRLMKQCSEVAGGRKYVKTLMGRRSRFPDGQRLHKALNRVIQGSAADVFKLKLIELYRERHRLGLLLRMPVHDEVVFDCDDDPKIQAQIQELMNTQVIQLQVPILWETGYGNNWREANGQ